MYFSVQISRVVMTIDPLHPMFLLLIILAIIFCVVIIYLPYAAGLTTLQKAEHHTLTQRQSVKKQYSGYVPPDEELRLQQEEQSKGKTSLRERVKVTNDDIPIRIKLNQDGVLRKRSAKVDIDRDPNSYDYDLDELINDETVGEAQREASEFYAKQDVGTNREELV